MAKIDALLKEMVSRGASDLHLREGRKPSARINGAISEILPEPLNRAVLFEMLSEAAGPARWEAFARHCDLDFAYQMDANSRFRANYFVQATGAGAVFRLIPVKVRTLDELSAPPAMKGFADLKAGLVLVTGPTGSGKSTTMAALIDQINSTHGKHIVTIEEPIEFVHPNKKSVITQREVPDHAPSFHAGLKAAVREDADVILIGEMRDLETIETAMTAAETGHLVLATLHTPDTVQTVQRIYSVFPAEHQNAIVVQLASTLQAVVAQKLLPRADGKGRVLACEVLVATPAIRAHIRERKEHMCYSEMQTGRKHQMQTMDSALLELYQRGEISYDMAISHAREPGFIRQRTGESAAKESLPFELDRQLRRAEK